jgi:hypothetical protein
VGTLEGQDAWSVTSTYNLVTWSFKCTLVPKPFPYTMDLYVMKMHSSNFCNCFPFIPVTSCGLLEEDIKSTTGP